MVDNENNYDALLVLSFGGPEAPDEVMPFLENVLRGRNVPRNRMLEVAKHYLHFDGISPINVQNRALVAALKAELDKHGPQLPVYWGNRNWHPMLVDTMRRMRDDGVRRCLAFVTSAYSSYSGCRQYRENIAAAQEAIGNGAPEVDKLRVFYNHPGFIGPMIERVKAAIAQIPSARQAAATILYTAHSLPTVMADTCDYVVQLEEACRLVSAGVQRTDQRLIYQSRSGPPQQPLLEPDVIDVIRELHDRGDVRDLVIVPIGFISDHMEVKFDLDTEAKVLCDELGMNMVRAGTVGVHPDFISMVRQLVLERTDSAPRAALGTRGPNHDVCPEDCCPAMMRRRPA